MNRTQRSDRVLFFTAFLLSAFGYEFIYFIMTVHIFDLSQSGLNIGIFTALTFIPKLFSGLIGGLVDRVGKAKSFALSAVGVAVLMGVMAMVDELCWIYIIWFGASIFFTVIINARASLMADLLTGRHLHAGNSLMLTLLNAAKILGPLLGGVIVMSSGPKLLLAFTAGVYLLVAVSSSLIGQSNLSLARETDLISSATRGFRFILQNRPFRLLTSISFFWRLFLGMQLSLFVVYIKLNLQGSSEQYGYFLTIMGLGSIAGSLVGRVLANRIDPLRLIAVGLTLHYGSFMLYGWCRSLPAANLIVFVSSAIFYLTLVGMHSIRDQITPSEIRSSAYGATTSILTPAAIISMLAGGYLADHLSAPWVFTFAGAISLIVLFILLASNKGAQLVAEEGDKNTVGSSQTISDLKLS